MEEERLQILRLVETGRVTPEQAAELLRALHVEVRDPTGEAVKGPAHGDSRSILSRGWSSYMLAADSTAEGPTWLRIRVTDAIGRQTADVQVPLSIVRVALRIGSRWVPQLRLLDPAWVLATLRLRTGKPVFTFKDSADGDRVVITVE